MQNLCIKDTTTNYTCNLEIYMKKSCVGNEKPPRNCLKQNPLNTRRIHKFNFYYLMVDDEYNLRNFQIFVSDGRINLKFI